MCGAALDDRCSVAAPRARRPLAAQTLGLAGCARAGPAGGGAARRRRGRLGAPELSNPGPRVRLLPGAGRRGTDRAAPPGQGRRAGRGSVLAGPQPQQAGGAAAGATARSSPPTSSTIATTSASSPTISATSSGSARATRCGTRSTRSPAPGPRPTNTRWATRSPSAPAAATSRCGRCRCGPARSPCRWSWARSTSTPRPRSWCASASASRPPPISTASSRTSRIVLENARSRTAGGCRYRQEIEIRRRASFFDFPARGIIRGRWEIADYDLNVAAPAGVLAGPAIGGLRQPRPDDSTWAEPLSAGDRRRGGPGQPAGHGRAAGGGRADRRGRARSAVCRRSRLATGSLSDLARVNRVQGLALGFGGVLGVCGSRVQLRPQIGYGTSDERVTGGLTVLVGHGRHPGLARRASAGCAISPICRSSRPRSTRCCRRKRATTTATTSCSTRRRRGPPPAERAHLARRSQLAVEESRSVGVELVAGQRPVPAQPAARVPAPAASPGWPGAGQRRDRRAAGSPGAARAGGGRGRGRLCPGHRGRPLARDRPGRGSSSPGLYLGAGTERLPGLSELRARRAGDAARRAVPGLRGQDRGAGARGVAVRGCRFPAMPLGSFASTGRRITVAPFVAAGWTGAADPGAALGRHAMASGRSRGWPWSGSCA